MAKAAFFIYKGGAMYPVVDESQNRKEYRSHRRRSAPPCPTPLGREEGQGARVATDEEDDLRIMQHFARNLIERSQET
jgi:hypothetical protein